MSLVAVAVPARRGWRQSPGGVWPRPPGRAPHAQSREGESRAALDCYMADYGKREIEKIPSRGFGAGCKILFRRFWIGVPHGRRKLA